MVRKQSRRVAIGSRKILKLAMTTKEILAAKPKPDSFYLQDIPVKVRRSIAKRRGTVPGVSPISFSREVSLSPLYKKESGEKYINQVFTSLFKIGQGCFGDVYQAKSKEDSNYYAIKVTNDTHSFIDKGEVMRLEKIPPHENCVRFFVAWQEGYRLYIQMELCTTSLDKFLTVYHQVDEGRSWEIFVDIALGLQHLHSHELIHLDLKPANIMIAENGVCKIGDFGLAVDLREVAESGRRAPSFLGVSEGDGKYVALEVLREKIYSKAADVFSLGLLMMETVSDVVLPNSGPDWIHIREGAVPECYTQRCLTPCFRQVIERMLLKNYLQRPSIAEVLKAPLAVDVLKIRMLGQRFDIMSTWDEDYVEYLLNNTDDVPTVEIGGPSPPRRPYSINYVSPTTSRTTLKELSIIDTDTSELSIMEQELQTILRMKISTKPQTQNLRKNDDVIMKEPVQVLTLIQNQNKCLDDNVFANEIHCAVNDIQTRKEPEVNETVSEESTKDSRSNSSTSCCQNTKKSAEDQVCDIISDCEPEEKSCSDEKNCFWKAEDGIVLRENALDSSNVHTRDDSMITENIEGLNEEEFVTKSRIKRRHSTSTETCIAIQDSNRTEQRIPETVRKILKRNHFNCTDKEMINSSVTGVSESSAVVLSDPKISVKDVKTELLTANVIESKQLSDDDEVVFVSVEKLRPDEIKNRDNDECAYDIDSNVKKMFEEDSKKNKNKADSDCENTIHNKTKLAERSRYAKSKNKSKERKRSGSVQKLDGVVTDEDKNVTKEQLLSQNHFKCTDKEMIDTSVTGVSESSAVVLSDTKISVKDVKTELLTANVIESKQLSDDDEVVFVSVEKLRPDEIKSRDNECAYDIDSNVKKMFEEDSKKNKNKADSDCENTIHNKTKLAEKCRYAKSKNKSKERKRSGSVQKLDGVVTDEDKNVTKEQLLSQNHFKCTDKEMIDTSVTGVSESSAVVLSDPKISVKDVKTELLTANVIESKQLSDDDEVVFVSVEKLRPDEIKSRDNEYAYDIDHNAKKIFEKYSKKNENKADSDCENTIHNKIKLAERNRCAKSKNKSKEVVINVSEDVVFGKSDHTKGQKFKKIDRIIENLKNKNYQQGYDNGFTTIKVDDNEYIGDTSNTPDFSPECTISNIQILENDYSDIRFMPESSGNISVVQEVLAKNAIVENIPQCTEEMQPQKITATTPRHTDQKLEFGEALKQGDNGVKRRNGKPFDFSIERLIANDECYYPKSKESIYKKDDTAYFKEEVKIKKMRMLDDEVASTSNSINDQAISRNEKTRCDMVKMNQDLLTPASTSFSVDNFLPKKIETTRVKPTGVVNPIPRSSNHIRRDDYAERNDQRYSSQKLLSSSGSSRNHTTLIPG
ncbi:hypothetical protein FQR65_LT13830 [Abscondita terminalis]|nr:hypothetical protein FQR65_LT13830 [Abscondita terminalis]